MAKADYSKIASHYDKGRPLLRKNISLWMKLISDQIQFDKTSTVLDLGCGTGRFSLPLARELGLNVTGADSSSAMLAIAQTKDSDHRIKWEIQDADNLTYADRSFDCVFMSHLLHHVDNPKGVLANCYDVLHHSGSVAIRYGAMEQIKDDPEHRFFPGVLKIDEKRTPSVHTVEQWLTDAGFDRIQSTEVEQNSYEAAEAHYEAASHKGNSVLNMITPEEFLLGLERFREYVKENPTDPWLTRDLMTLTVGYKP